MSITLTPEQEERLLSIVEKGLPVLNPEVQKQIVVNINVNYEKSDITEVVKGIQERLQKKGVTC